MENNIAILAFKTQAANNLAKFNLIDQVIDEYQDATGIDASASTNERTAGTGTAKYYDGATSSTPTVSGNWNSTGTTGDYTWYSWTGVTSSGSFTTDTAQDYEYLVIAGGGSGGNYYAGGGGAGGYRNSTVGELTGGGGSAEAKLAVGVGTISGITVGAGGTGPVGSAAVGDDGNNSVFGSITAIGGGGSGARMAANSAPIFLLRLMCC